MLVITQDRRRQLAVLASVEVLLAALAWRDLARRTDDEVRGNKKLWRLLVAINPGNSVFYWLFGRR
jgi:hypothetical protein